MMKCRVLDRTRKPTIGIILCWDRPFQKPIVGILLCQDKSISRLINIYRESLSLHNRIATNISGRVCPNIIIFLNYVFWSCKCQPETAETLPNNRWIMNGSLRVERVLPDGPQSMDNQRQFQIHESNHEFDLHSVVCRDTRKQRSGILIGAIPSVGCK